MGKSWKESKSRNKFDRYAGKKKNKSIKNKGNKPKFETSESYGGDWED